MTAAVAPGIEPAGTAGRTTHQHGAQSAGDQHLFAKVLIW
jgi:hypothetical protein